MHFSCSRRLLGDTLAVLGDIIQPRSTKPVLQNIKLVGNEDGSLSLAATDLEVSLCSVITVEKIAQPEAMLVPGAQLTGMVRDEWAENMEFSSHDQRIQIRTKNGRYELCGSSADDFPEQPELDCDQAVVISGQDLFDGVQKTSFATAKSDSRFALNGIFVSIDKGGIEFASSDTHRLSIVRKKIKNRSNIQGQAIVITKGMNTFARLAQTEEEVQMQLTGHYLLAKTAASSLATRLVDGQFPRYKDVIPANLDRKITMNRETFMKTLRLVGQMSNQETHSIILSAEGNKAVISVTGSDRGEAEIEIDAEVEGGACKAVFNHIYLIDMLRVLEGDSVTMQVKDGNYPVRIDEKDFTHVIMPIRADAGH